jgi:hypothetical protein
MFRHRILTAFGVVMIGASILLSSAWIGSVNAAQTAQVGDGNALKVSPVRIDVKMDPGTSQVITVTIQNLTSSKAILHPVVNDFVAAGDETGRPNIILNEDEYAPSHSLKRLVDPLADITVDPGESRPVKVTITAPKDAPGGGYYGAVRFAPASTDGDKNVNLAASVGTLVLLRMSGDITEELSVESFDVRKKDGETFGKPSTFFMDKSNISAVIRFKNTGNVQVEPFGTISLKRFGKTVADYQVNNADVRGSVLPDSIRRFDVSMDKLSSFGKYTLSGNFGYGESGQLLTVQTTFYIIPLFMILIGVGIILLLLFLIFVLPRMIKAYNRRVIRRASRRRY